MSGAGHAGRSLSEDEVAGIVRSFLEEQELDGKKVLVVVADGTGPTRSPGCSA